MPDPAPYQCPPGRQCLNVEALNGRVSTVEATSVGQILLLASKVEDLRRAVSDLPRDVAARLTADRAAAGGKFDKGDINFKDVFGRLRSIERSVFALWLLFGVIAAGKVAGAVWPAIGKLIP